MCRRGFTYDITPIANVARETKDLPHEWVVNGCDISEAYLKYAKPIVGSDGQHVLVQGDVRHKVEGKLSETVNQDHHEKVQMNYALESGMALHIKGGMTVVIEGGMQLTLKVGGSFVDISPLGVCIQGPLVNINSGGAPGSGTGASPDDPEVEQEPNSTSGSKSSD